MVQQMTRYIMDVETAITKPIHCSEPSDLESLTLLLKINFS